MVHNFDPILVDLGILKIHWYSLAYIFGILIGWWYGRFLIKNKLKIINHENYLKNFDDLISYIIIGVIVGTYSSVFIATPVMFDTQKGKAIAEETE